MLTVITKGKQISALYTKFENRLHEFFNEQIDCWVGYPGGSFEDTVRYSSKLNIWMSQMLHENKFWNGFGVGKPIAGKNHSINGEVNFPNEGINRGIAGVFAEDEDGNVIVLHRGKIGGGKPGIGKTYFMDNFTGNKVAAIDGGRESIFCVVGELSSNRFPQQVAYFIEEIFRIKNLEQGGEASEFSSLSNFSYTDESFGESVTEATEPRIINRTHGIIVKALADALQSRGHKIANDRNRDLFIHWRGKITHLFEIKTTSSTQCLYAALGQLLLYSIPTQNNVKLFAVLPRKLNEIVENRFFSLGIQIIYFAWNDKDVVFTDFDIF